MVGDYLEFEKGLSELQEALKGVGPGAGGARFKDMASGLFNKVILLEGHANYELIIDDMQYLLSELWNYEFQSARDRIESIYYKLGR